MSYAISLGFELREAEEGEANELGIYVRLLYGLDEARDVLMR